MEDAVGQGAKVLAGGVSGTYHEPDSGIGREGLGYSIDECTQIKTVVLPS